MDVTVPDTGVGTAVDHPTAAEMAMKAANTHAPAITVR
jgi:hypothetical protein